MIPSTREDSLNLAPSRLAVIGPGLGVVIALALFVSGVSFASGLSAERAVVAAALLSFAPFVWIAELASGRSFWLMPIIVPTATIVAAFLHAALPRRWTACVSILGFLSWAWCQLLLVGWLTLPRPI
jgi:hypothetical protein